MNVDFLIVGQGIAGTLISYELLKKGKSVMVLDQPDNRSASRVAGAILNPVVLKGRKRADDNSSINSAIETYQDISRLIKQKIITQKEMVVFPENEVEYNNYRKRTGEKYIAGLALEGDKVSADFEVYFPPIIVAPVWQVNALALLRGWKNYLDKRGCYYQMFYTPDEIIHEKEFVTCNGIAAEKIVFCEGVAARQNKLFANYPFVANRGDVLLLNIPGLSQEKIYHKKFRLIPYGESLFWFGSNYKWEFDNLSPDEEWKNLAERDLRSWLKLPYTVVSHTTAERPTTTGQIPFCKIHDGHPSIIIFNGLGTKGFTNGPSLAKQLADLIA